MDNMQRQMDMFEEGGLRDEGGMVDEESGNEVPIGSTRKEVRDDIPAQVSEGEFVFPADVVRFLGLEKLMEMRQAAKMGLKQMEAMGQMGNSDEATMPDDMPFGMADLVVIGGPDKDDKPKKKAQGGLFLQSGGSIRMPDFDFSNQDVRIYVKEGSPDRRIPFFDGEPVIPIPAGYTLKGSAPVKTETEEAIPTGGDRDPTSPFPDKTPFQEAGGWDMEFGDPPDAAKVDLWIKEAEKTTGNTPMIATGVAAALGGPLAAFVHLGNKMNAKGRDASFEKALAAAKKTATAGQVAKLNAIDKAIKEGADKNIFNKIVDGISNALGFGEKEKNIVTKVGGNAGNSLANPNKDAFSYTQTGRQDIDTAPLTGAKPSLEESKESEEFGKIMGDAVFAEGYTGQGLSDGALEDADIRTMQGDLQKQINDAELELGIPKKTETDLALEYTDFGSPTENIPFDEMVAPNVNLQDNVTIPLDNKEFISGREKIKDGTYKPPVDRTGLIPEMKTGNAAYDALKASTLNFNNQYENYQDMVKRTENMNLTSYDYTAGVRGATALNKQLDQAAKSFTTKVAEVFGKEPKPEEDEIIRSDGTATPFTPRSKQTKPDPVTPSTSSSDDDDRPSLAEQMQKAAQAKASKASTATAASKSAAQKKAIAAGVSGSTAGKLSGSKMISGTGVGAGTGGSNITGPMNRGGLASRRK